MKTIKKIFLILILSIMLLPTISNAATEKIYSYESEIYINEDASMIVEETIKVYAGGNNIKRGIYRDFPTKYKDKQGNNYNVGFEVLEVLRDGKKEPYKTEKQQNGVRIRIGDADKTLSPGFYTYTIKYKTNRQIGYFEDHDELYWNVTGNGWEFTIDEVKAIVHLPDNADMSKVNFEAYTGSQGSTDKKYIANKNKYNNTVTFTTTNNLYSKQGLTIVVGFEKGIVHKPTMQEYIAYWFQDSKGVSVGLCGAVIIIIYCFITWCKVGKDPKKDVIIPRYNPPEGLSPAEVKYIDSMGKYDKVFETSILNLAVKGYIKIETYVGEMSLKKQETIVRDDLTEDEKYIYEHLPDNAVLEYSSHLQKKLVEMKSKQKKLLNQKFNKKMYSQNFKLFTISELISAFVFITSIYFSNVSYKETLSTSTMIMWLVILSIVLSVFLKEQRVTDKIMTLLNILPITISGIFIIVYLILALGTGLILLLLLLVIINVVYGFLIKAYTKEGRKIKDEIEGFKLFIKTASEDEIRNQTPETFDKYFPYAYALGLENEWSEKFEDILEEYNYEPTWCSGMYYGSTFHATTFTNSFSSSFNKGISSASVHPSSIGGESGFSSSSRGGGFSGGGGRRPEAVEAGKG